jgi:uncharacterized membrane protein
MTKARLEAFSDSVMAVIITVMVLLMKVPRGDALEDLTPLAPPFLAYVLSFVYVGIYWVNHHHLIHTVKRVTGGIMWANLSFLFWLSLFPLATEWTGDHPTAPWPAALYGLVLLAAALSWRVLQRSIIRTGSLLREALGADFKGRLSPVLYVVGTGVAFFRAWLAQILFALVALIWIVPDRRIERTLETPE